MATRKAKAKIGATVNVATVAKVDKARKANAKRGAKQHYADSKAHALWGAIATVAKLKMIPSDLRVATKGNAQARRQWCADNKATIIHADQVCHKVSDRPDNAIRARLISLGNIDASAKGIGYVRVLDSVTASRQPDHPMINAVYLYRIK
jgi:hypothetical protein